MNDLERSGRRLSRVALVAVICLLSLPSAVAAQTAGSGGGAGADDGSSATSPKVPSDRSLRERIAYRLGGYHFSPDRVSLDGMASSDRIAETLRSIVRDDSERPSLRARAIEMLVEYPSDETVALLESYLDPAPSSLPDKKRDAYGAVRLRAIMNLAELHGGEKAVRAVEGLLDADDLQARLMAIAAIGRYGGSAGEERLRRLAESTDDSVVRDEIAEHIDLE